MYQSGELIKFSPFVLKNGNQPKPKYCIVLGQIDEKVMMVSLPTSKDHVPSDAMVERGCVDIPERGVNAFVLNSEGQIEPVLFQAIRDCVKKAKLLRRKYRNLL